MQRKRIVLATWGSLGDLHPLIAVGLELRERGHDVLIAANAYYAETIAALGFEFQPLRPDIGPDDNQILAYLMDLRRGPEQLIKELILPGLADMYADLSRAAEGADLIAASELVYAAPILAEKTGARWASIILAPLSFFSAFDPPVVPKYQWLARFYRPWLMRSIIAFGRALTRRWTRPVTELRGELGLGPGAHPVFDAKYSPHLVLAMFSSAMGRPQPDWPPNTLQTGFAFYDQSEGELPHEVEEFLAAGEAPIVFTLGSSAVRTAGEFFQESVDAAVKLGRRALLVAGDERPAVTTPANVLVTSYLPYSKIFPRASVIVQQGGIGTIAQALRAGRPMLIVPFAFDQPDNAARVRRLGVGESVARNRYRRNRVAAVLQRIVGDPRYARRATEVASVVKKEDGAMNAAVALAEL